jgi:exosome complex component CSL4
MVYGMKKQSQNSIAFPGDLIAEIEEYEGGKNTFVSDGSVRASAMGDKEYDLKRRIVRIDQKKPLIMPKIGDEVIGYIEMLFGPMISVKLLYLNGKLFSAGFSAIASTRINFRERNRERGERGERRAKVAFRVGDIIRGRVTSLLNSSIHITIAEKEYGVLYTLCYLCGGDTVRVNNAVKCIECGNYEERKVTNDYGSDTFKAIFRSAKGYQGP